MFLAREPNHGVIKFWRPRENGDPWILVNSGPLGPAHDITVFHTQISAVPVPSMEKASASDQKIQAGEQHFGTAEIQFKGFATFATLTTMLYYLSIKSE